LPAELCAAPHRADIAWRYFCREELQALATAYLQERRAALIHGISLRTQVQVVSAPHRCRVKDLCRIGASAKDTGSMTAMHLGRRGTGQADRDLRINRVPLQLKFLPDLVPVLLRTSGPFSAARAPERALQAALLASSTVRNAQGADAHGASRASRGAGRGQQPRGAGSGRCTVGDEAECGAMCQPRPRSRSLPQGGGALERAARVRSTLGTRPALARTAHARRGAPGAPLGGRRG
jgi:hypothetical protein